MPLPSKDHQALKFRPFFVTEEGWESLIEMQIFLEEYSEFFGQSLYDSSSIRNNDKRNLFEFNTEMENGGYHISNRNRNDYQSKSIDDVKLSTKLYQYLESKNIIQPNYSNIEFFVLELLHKGRLEFPGKLSISDNIDDMISGLKNMYPSINSYITTIQDELLNIINHADNIDHEKLIDLGLEEKIRNLNSPENKMLLIDFIILQVYFKAVYDNLYE